MKHRVSVISMLLVTLGATAQAGDALSSREDLSVASNKNYFTISKSQFAVFTTEEQATKSLQSQIWLEAFDACEGQPLPLLSDPIGYKTVGSGGNLSVVGTAIFSCGF